MTLEFRLDLSGYRKDMDAIVRKQLPFAQAQALTMTAGHVGLAWQDEMKGELDRPTPFTLNAVAVRPARKSNLTATVYVKDIAATYLEPFVDGGPHALGSKKGLLTPKNVALNAYGNLTRNKLATLKGKGNVFVGAVKFKSGEAVNGVWQRGARGSRRGRMGGLRPGGYGTKGSHNLKHNRAMGLSAATTLKLLIRFSDPLPVTQRLDFRGRADVTVRDEYAAAFAKALANALATAR